MQVDILDKKYRFKDGYVIHFSQEDNYELVEQNPAWSEGDEENFNWFEKFFLAESVVAEGKDIPQDKYLWFKNLKERVQPQNTWKPTKSQLDVLHTHCSSTVDGVILTSLYNDLIKL